MTRINLVPVIELSDQHLLAEYRELPRMFSFAKKTIKGIEDIPKSFTLGKGHMSFFLNKPNYLEDRHKQLKSELLSRGINLTPFPKFKMYRDKKFPVIHWTPTIKEISISRKRIKEKLNQKPEFYRWT
jgi:deoxyribonuclease (pyrimidine dimer)